MIDYISKFLTNIFGTKSSRDLKKLWPIVDEIKSHEAAIKALSDEELKQKTEGFKRLIQERTDEVTRQIEEIKEKMVSNDETITLAYCRVIIDQLTYLVSDMLI